MKQTKTNRRWGLMVLSVVSAFLVWLGVVNVADPVITETVEVPVEIINDEVLTGNSLTYEISGKKTATISYEVKTTNSYRIHASDFRAYADMTEMWDVTGAIPIKIEVLNHSEYLEGNPTSRTSTIKITTEPLQRKQFTINYTTEGTMEEDYEPGVVTLTPETLNVEGPESQIGQISSVGIVIPVDGVSSETSGSVEVRYYDANNNEISLSDRVVSDCTDVLYSMTVLKGKTLALAFNVSGTVADGYRFTGVDCETKSVAVVGLKSALASIHTLTIPAESLNLDGADTSVVRTVDLTDYLPEGITLAGSTRSEINVTLLVEKLQEKTYTVQVDDTSYVGASSQYTYQVIPETVEIRVRALQEDLDTLTIGSSDLNINVSGLAVGEHVGRAALKLDPSYEIMETSAFTIRVEQTEEPDASAETTAAQRQTETAAQRQTETAAETEEGEAVPAGAESASAGTAEAEESVSGSTGTDHTGQETEAAESEAGNTQIIRPEETLPENEA